MAVLTEGDFSQRKCTIEDLEDLNSISRKLLVSSMTLDKPHFWAQLPLCVIRVGSLRSCQQVNTEKQQLHALCKLLEKRCHSRALRLLVSARRERYGRTLSDVL